MTTEDRRRYPGKYRVMATPVNPPPPSTPMPRLDPRATDPLTAEDVPPFRRRPDINGGPPKFPDDPWTSLADDPGLVADMERAELERQTVGFQPFIHRQKLIPETEWQRMVRVAGIPVVPDRRPPVLGYVIWAVSLLLAALAGALVALWMVGRL